MQAVLRVSNLPEKALDAAAAFHSRYVPQARSTLGEADALALVFPEAAYDHASWRRAAIADLAREAAPKRVNGVTGGNAAAVEAAVAWLEQAPGVTGQLLPAVASDAGISGI